MTTSTIKIATASDEALIINALVLAFSADSVVCWTWSNPQQYLMHFPSFAKAFGGKAFAHGSAYYIDGYAGAALWLPPDIHIASVTLGGGAPLLPRRVNPPLRLLSAKTFGQDFVELHYQVPAR